MKTTLTVKVNNIKELAEFLGKQHELYMEYVLTHPGKYHKDEKWDLKAGTATVTWTDETV